MRMTEEMRKAEQDRQRELEAAEHRLDHMRQFNQCGEDTPLMKLMLRELMVGSHAYRVPS